MADNFAIVAGVNRYPGISDLAGPENDARWFHTWLVENGVVTADKASLITGPEPPHPNDAIDCLPDIATIDRAFERLLRIGMKSGVVGKRLYLFFAGHGFGPNLNAAALLSSNADLLLGTTGHHLNAVDYADWFATAAYFDEIVLFMDCCRDDMPRAPERKPPWQSVRNGRGGSVKRFYGLATKWAKKAREGVADNGAVHGYFTQALMAAFAGGAVDQGGSLRTGNIERFVFNYFTTRVKEKVDALQFTEPVFDPKDDFVVADGLKRQLTRVTVRFGGALNPGSCALVGGKPTRMTANTAGDNPWQFDVPFGHYSILDGAGAQLKEFGAFGEPVVLDV